MLTDYDDRADTVRPENLLVGAERLAGIAHDAWQPLGLVDLDACPADARIEALPPFPLVGYGNASHPLAPRLDAVVEAPFTVAALVRTVSRCPHAASVLVQLLRAAEGLEPARALVLESMAYGLLQGSAEFAAWLAGHAGQAAATTPGVASTAPGAGRVIVARHDAELRLTLDRPAAHNAIDVPMRDQLHEALAVALLDPGIRSVRLDARGRSFSIGGDLAEFGTMRDPATAHLIRAQSLPATRLAGCADRLQVHVQGACVGAGVEMAAFARRVTASARAWFQLPEVGMGLIPGAGGCVSVPRRIGRQRAALLMLTGARINAATALRLGLVDALEADEPADGAALDGGIGLADRGTPGA